jgi:hypothetical protein
MPPEHLTIEVTLSDVAITPDRGAARTVHPGRRDEPIAIGPVTAITTATWESGRLVIAYKAWSDRVVRYTYAIGQNPTRLTVDVEFLENGTGDRVRRVYEPTPAVSTDALPPSSAPREAVRSGDGGLLSGASRSGAIDQRPDAALKGLTHLGIVVEDLAPEAAKCGLMHDALEAAVTKRLSDAGFKVIRNSDDDTYLYVNINTVTASSGLCVSRYDVTLYSHAAAPLAHTAAPVPLQAELLHRGGLAGGAPAAHAESVLKSVLENVDLFTTRMKSANQ